jgi:hypothetical protein
VERSVRLRFDPELVRTQPFLEIIEAFVGVRLDGQPDPDVSGSGLRISRIANHQLAGDGAAPVFRRSSNQTMNVRIAWPNSRHSKMWNKTRHR